MSTEANIIHRSAAVLADDASSTGDVYQASRVTSGEKFQGRSVLRGIVQASHDGLLEIYQAYQFSDISTLPAVGSAGNLLRIALTFTGGANGMQVAEAISAPFVRTRFTNNSGLLQTAFRIHLEVSE